MVEPESDGMQGLTWETNKSTPDVFRDNAPFGVARRAAHRAARIAAHISSTCLSTTSAATIDRISDQGMSDMSHMHSNLVRAPGSQHTFHH